MLLSHCPPLVSLHWQQCQARPQPSCTVLQLPDWSWSRSCHSCPQLRRAVAACGPLCRFSRRPAVLQRFHSLLARRSYRTSSAKAVCVTQHAAAAANRPHSGARRRCRSLIKLPRGSCKPKLRGGRLGRAMPPSGPTALTCCSLQVTSEALRCRDAIALAQLRSVLAQVRRLPPPPAPRRPAPAAAAGAAAVCVQHHGDCEYCSPDGKRCACLLVLRRLSLRRHRRRRCQVTQRQVASGCR